LFPLFSLPERYGIFGVEHAGFVYKFAIFAQAHIRFLGHRIGGIDGDAPFQFLALDAFEHFLEERRVCLAEAGDALRVHAREFARVCFGFHHHARVVCCVHQFPHWGDKIQLLIAGIFEKDLFRAGEDHHDGNMRPGLDGFLIERQVKFLPGR